MTNTKFAIGGSTLAIMMALGMSGPAFAQQGAAPAQPSTSEEIVVTGSYIRGTPQNAALPVDVITGEELIRRGSPSTLELIKSLPQSAGVLGDANQFDSRGQGADGSGSINLRGLGPERTLVLLNGHRMVINPFALVGAGAVDTNTIPQAAIGRIEVLKEGAAATYGSDAIGGVVNFITRRNFSGFDLSGNFSYIDGSDGDYSGSALWGHEGERAHLVVSLGYQHRSQLPVLERDWAHVPITVNPQGGYSAAGSPSSFIPLGASTTAFRDPGCVALGGIASFSGTVPTCNWAYNVFDNLVEDEDRYQVFTDFTLDMGDSLQFHSDLLVARTFEPHWTTSPSYALLQGPTAGANAWNSPVAGRFYVPASNPGAAYLISQGSVAGNSLVTGLPVSITPAQMAAGFLNVANRPYALGGNPLFDYGGATGKRDYRALRLSGGFDGTIWNDVNWSFNVTYGEERAYRTGRDEVVERVQRALKGLGGPNCPLVGGTPGVGNCYYFDPFNYQIPANAISGVVNPSYLPAGYNPGGLQIGNNDPTFIDWMFPNGFTRATETLTVADLVFSGSTGINLPGGDVRWAAGGQWRRERYETQLGDLGNYSINPCINSPDGIGDMSCTAATGPLGFLGGAFEQNLDRSIWAVFTEFSLPVTDALDMQLAARYEDYGDPTGSTFNPKLSARYQLTDSIALRASAGSTFRAPSLPNVQNSSVTALQSVLGTFRAVDIFGNPDLDPETADTYNLGVIFETPSVFITLDWWDFQFDNPIVTEPLAGMVQAVLVNPTGCTDPALAALRARFTFATGVCSNANLTRVRTYVVNGAAVETSGVDLSGRFSFDALGGSMELGGTGTYVIEYKTGAQSVEGVVVQPAFDAVGMLNYQTTAYPLPQLRGNAYVQWSNPMHRLRLTANYVDSYEDQRPTITGAGKTISSWTTYDLNYQLSLESDTMFTLSVTNLTDEDPSLARLDLNYDPFTGSALGRTVRVGVRQQF
jgi:iron complex outermembrane receptor protein